MNLWHQARSMYRFMILNKAPAIMNYDLNQVSAQQEKASTLTILKNLLLMIREERSKLLLALLAILTNSGLNLLNPYIVGYTIDHYVVKKNYNGVLMNAALLLGLALI